MLLKLILPILIVAALAGGLFYFLAHKSQNISKTQNTAASAPKNVYTNTTYSFSIQYPQDWQVVEFDQKDGANFQQNGENVVTVSVLPRFLSGSSMSFSEYTKSAAIEEIQNYKKLYSYEQIKTDSGLDGYKTTWNVQGMAVPGSGAQSYISNPITYFQLPQDNTKSLQITLEKQGQLQQYNNMIRTLKYL